MQTIILSLHERVHSLENAHGGSVQGKSVSRPKSRRDRSADTTPTDRQRNGAEEGQEDEEDDEEEEEEEERGDDEESERRAENGAREASGKKGTRKWRIPSLGGTVASGAEGGEKAQRKAQKSPREAGHRSPQTRKSRETAPGLREVDGDSDRRSSTVASLESPMRRKRRR